MKLDDITPLVLTYNEAPNIRRVLERLTWAREIVVVDSFSTDGTAEVARSFPQVRFVQREFDRHAAQWNHGVDLCRTPWVLALDADYALSDEFVAGLKEFAPAPEIAAGFARFRYCIFGRPLRGTLYPPRAVLFRRDACRYEQDGHTQDLKITGSTTSLPGWIDHDDRKPLSRWLWAQARYAELEAQKLAATPRAQLTAADRLRRGIVFAPAVVFLYTLLGKGLILDDWRGWYYVLQRTLAEMVLSLKLLEAKFESSQRPPGPRA